LSFFKTVYNFEIINIRAIYSQQIFNSEEISSMFSGESLSQNYFIAVLSRSGQEMCEFEQRVSGDESIFPKTLERARNTEYIGLELPRGTKAERIEIEQTSSSQP
jgi:hypothetical protein